MADHTSDPTPTSPRPADSAGAMLGAPGRDDLSPEDLARAEEMAAAMAEIRAGLLSASAAQIVANHAMGLYELAAVHLAEDDPDLTSARLAIDAMAALLDATGDRLGEMGGELRDALTVLQTFYVRRSTAPTAAPTTAPSGDD